MDAGERVAHRFGVRGHVRALKAATCRRTPKTNHVQTPRGENQEK